MTFRTRLVLATTVAVVVAVLAASSAAFLVARNTLLQAADNSLTTATQKIVAGQDVGATTANVVQVVDPSGIVLVGGGLPVTPQVQQVASGLAPPYFNTVTAGGNQMRERVEHLPAGTILGTGGELIHGGALQIATLLNVTSELNTLAILLGVVALIGVVVAVVLGLLVARTALIPLNALTDTVEELAETTDVTRRLEPGRPDELGRLRRTFNRLLEALESSRRAQSQLVLDASHELRTPLTSLRTNLEVIRRVEELSDEDRSVLVHDVLVQLQELTDLVGDLAELARGDQHPTEREPLRLDLLVRDAVDVQTTHGRADEVTFELRAEPCWVRGHADRLDRAVGNLLDNARKWSPPGQTVSVECVDGHVVVHDRGPGISDEDLPHIFDRFYRSPSARGLPGSGLGLAIVAQVVKAEGGTIVAENDPSGGARFTMSLPTISAPEEPEGSHEVSAAGSEPL